MKLLVICPDYASHYLPLGAVASAAQRRGMSVLVATGPSIKGRVQADGFDWRHLRMSRGGNPGRIDQRAAAIAADDDLAEFFAATRHGMVATLRQQARQRSGDLLWEPLRVAVATASLVDRTTPDVIVVDHLAFSAALGLRAARRPFVTFVAGHPSQLPGEGEVYGYPVGWPATIPAANDDLTELRAECADVAARFTRQHNDVLSALAPAQRRPADAFAAHGDHVLFNSPEFLFDPARRQALPERHTFLGASVRHDVADGAAAEWLARIEGQPFVYASLGTFLSARTDVLVSIVEGLRQAGVPAAVATGVADRSALGPIPDDWLVAAELPQVAVLGAASAVISHGGNNTVTEALAAACPLVVLPLSTDQFSVAADLERVGLGRCLDPNRLLPADIGQATAWATSAATTLRAAEATAQLLSAPGTERAVDQLLAAAERGRSDRRPKCRRRAKALQG